MAFRFTLVFLLIAGCAAGGSSSRTPIDSGGPDIDGGRPVVDAGPRVDAGRDAGPRADAGTDGGAPLDAGADGGSDAGLDGGAPSDAGCMGGATRMCTNACGAGTETCAAGTWGACSAGPCYLTPAMTGNTTPSGSVSSSGDYGGTSAWNAFDAAGDASGALWLSGPLYTSPVWIEYEFTDGPRTVTRYGLSFANGSLTTRAPGRWDFQAWDGSSWVTLDGQTGQSGWSSGETREFTLASPVARTRYRVLIHEDNDSRDLIVTASVGEVFLYGQ